MSRPADTAAILSQDVLNGAEPLLVTRDKDGVLQVVGPRGNTASDAMVVGENEALKVLHELIRRKREQRKQNLLDRIHLKLGSATDSMSLTEQAYVQGVSY